MVLGNIDNFKGTGLVAFIDLLGYAKEIDEKWDDPEDNPLEKLLTLKKKMPVISNDAFGDTDRNSKSKLYPCRVQTISDSIIVSFGFEEPLNHQDVILATMAFLYTILDIWTKVIDIGFTVRGAADVGQIFWNEKEIIGPAFLSVYRLEQAQAKTSRIIISPALNKTLAEYLAKGSTTWDKNVLEMLRKDIDGYIIVNPHALYSSRDRTSVIAKLQKMQLMSKGFEKEKYTPLLAMLNSDDFPLKRIDLGKY